MFLNVLDLGLPTRMRALGLCSVVVISACSTMTQQPAVEPSAVPEEATTAPAAVTPEATPTAPEAPASAASAPPVPAENAASAVPLKSIAGPPQDLLNPLGGPDAQRQDWGLANNPPAADHSVPSLMDVPDAKPQIESIPRNGPNSPYQLKGQCYTPMSSQVAYKQKGLASWYGPGFHGKRTANGEVYNMYAMTAAHKTLPLPSYVRVRNPANRKEVVLRVNDRGPFHHTRLIDLSYTAALKLGLVGGKIAPVEIERITSSQIRKGSWRSRTEVSDAK
jgi:rare lipoprotein A (peptidoglycan hydrolase)